VGMEKDTISIAIVGHVDHGKSTIIGRLLADTGSLPQGKIEQVKSACERTSRRFEYAFLLDALEDERAQGITIDTARVFFKHKDRRYLILDAPGHIEFLKNMVTGAAHADAALVVVDAQEGIKENSRRHGYLLSILGLRSLAVVVNKMDLVNYDKKVFDLIVAEYGAFLSAVGLSPDVFIPASGVEGDNICGKSSRMAWYQGPTLLEAIEKISAREADSKGSFRLFVQDVYKFTRFGDSRRIVAGTVSEGSIAAGDGIVFYPSGKGSAVKSVESFSADVRAEASKDEAVGLTLTEQIYVTRGELAVQAKQSRPYVSSRLRAKLFWLGKTPLDTQKQYLAKIGTASVPFRVEEVEKVVDASSLAALEKSHSVPANHVGECILKFSKAVAFDTVYICGSTSRLVIVDQYAICGGGIIVDGLDDKQSWVRGERIVRNQKWIQSLVSSVRRAERYSQKPALVLITGRRQTDRKTLAQRFEQRLFEEGRVVFFLGMGNLLHGLDADVKQEKSFTQEHVRRLAELANIMLEAGLIFIVTAVELTQRDLELMRELVTSGVVKVCWLGEQVTTDIELDLHLPEENDYDTALEKLKELLYNDGALFRPW